MCRHAAYVGPSVAASALLSDLDHDLLHQSYQPRHLLTGCVCADGYGFGWYDRTGDGPAGRYAFAGPIWSDGNLATLAPAIHSDMHLAAVRNATIAGSNTPSNCAPFADGPHLFSLNGYLEDFPTWQDAINDVLGQRLTGATDGEWLFAWLLRLLDGDGDLASGVQALCRATLDLGAQLGKAAQLNILASDGVRVVASRSGSTPSQNSLFTLVDGDEFPDATLVASEPLYDDPLWAEVPIDSVVALQAGAPPVTLRV